MAEAFREIRQRSMAPKKREKGMLQTELADRLGITSSNVSRIENKRINQRPSDELLEKIANEFSDLTTYDELAKIRARSPDPDRRPLSEREDEVGQEMAQRESGAATKARAVEPSDGHPNLVAYHLPQIQALANSLSAQESEDATPPVAPRTRFVAVAACVVDELDRSLGSDDDRSLGRMAANSLVDAVWRVLCEGAGGGSPNAAAESAAAGASAADPFVEGRLEEVPELGDSYSRTMALLSSLLGRGTAGKERARRLRRNVIQALTVAEPG